MARKDVLRGLMAAQPTADPAAAPPRPARGAIGAVSRSIAELKARSVVEIDPHLIDAGGMQDRLETDDAVEATLRASIAEYGQQVPVLVRPHPEAEGRFQIVFGRRRVLAMRDLGQPVKALVRDLDDRELVLAQGQENTARRDLSFIEKVNFARQLAEQGYDRKVICDALSVDKTLISRMLSLAERISPDVIQAIGAAPSVGRDRWTRLAEMIDETATDAEELTAMVNLTASSPRSDDRFLAAWTYVTGILARKSPVRKPARSGRPTAAPPRRILSVDGAPLGSLRVGAKSFTVTLRNDGFDAWLMQNLPRLHADWQAAPRPDGEDDDPT
jgi:ParB family chromosome partitioning protein